MEMYEKINSLKQCLQQMKQNRASRQNGQTFYFSPFSRKQKQVLTWWCPESPVHDKDGIIADGAIRSGKTVSMSLSFVMWAMSSFAGQNFAMCGKTIGSFRRNVLFWLKLMLRSRGYSITDHRADNLVVIRKNGIENYFYIFGGKDERSQDLIQGITLAGVFFDEVALMPESFVNQATGRCSVEGSKFWFNCNPDGPYHWFKSKTGSTGKKKNIYCICILQWMTTCHFQQQLKADTARCTPAFSISVTYSACGAWLRASSMTCFPRSGTLKNMRISQTG